MIRFLKQLFCDHSWVVGRAASIDAARRLRWPNMHNRVCSQCSKEEPWADKADDEYDRLQAIKGRLIQFKDPADAILQAEERLASQDEDE